MSSTPANALDTPAGPGLHFYMQYLKQIWSHDCAGLFTTPFDTFYAADLEHHFSDGRVEVGGEKCWQFFRDYYGEYSKCSQDPISWVVVADDENETFQMHGQGLLKFTFKGDTIEHTLPRMFEYTIGKADLGKGTFGLQVRRLRDYYNEPLIYRTAYEK